VDISEDLPLVRADPQLLHHVLINILDNAAHHAGPGARIDVFARRDGLGVSLSIADDGPGLLDPREPGLDMFARIAGSDRKGGCGLGLAIVKGFGEAMGIETAFNNRTAMPGAEFTLSFPERLVIEEAATNVGARA
jgi:two-component system sensor histidine kinase KdpD